MKLTDLKATVYRLANVTTTKHLKAQYESIKPLDMRYKVSWEKALVTLQELRSKQLDPSDANKSDSKTSKTNSEVNFEQWINNPSNEYRDLFADADAAIQAFDTKLSKTKKLTKTALAMVESLDEFAEASSAEAKRLATITQQDQKNTQEANLN